MLIEDQDIGDIIEIISSVNSHTNVQTAKHTLEQVKHVLVSKNGAESHVQSKLVRFLFEIVYPHFFSLLDDTELQRLFYSILDYIPADLLISDVIRTGNIPLALDTIEYVLSTRLPSLYSQQRSVFVAQKSVDLLVSIPDRMANLIGAQTYDFISNTPDIPKLVQPKPFYSKLLAAIESTPLPNIMYISLLASKLCILSYSDLVAKFFLCNGIPSDYFSQLSPSSLYPLTKSLLMADSSHEQLVSIFKPILSSPDNSLYLPLSCAYSKFLCESVVPLSCAKKTVNLLFTIQDEDSFSKILENIAGLWGNSAFAATCSIEHQKSLGTILALLILTVDCLEPSSNLMKGVQFRLESEEPSLRTVAMKVASCLSKKLLPGQSLDFPVDLSELDDSFLQEEKEDPKPAVWELDSSEEESSGEDPDDLWRDWDNGKEYIIDVPKSNQPLRDPKAIPIPIYPLDILDYLKKGRKENEDTEYCELALSRIIERNIHLQFDKETILQISVQILSLHEFPDLRSKALLRMTVDFPKQVAPFLISQLPSRSLTVSDRLLIIDTLRVSSENLVAGPEDNSKKSSSLSVNRFYGKSGMFFFPLLETLFQLRSGLADSLVISRLFLSLCTILKCSAQAHTPRMEIQRMSLSLFQIAWNCREHKDVVVRRSVLWCFLQVLELSSDRFFQSISSDVSTFIHFLLQIHSHESDTVSRDTAAQCLHIFKRKDPLQSLINQ